MALVLDQSTKLYAETTHLIAPPVPSMAFHRASAETVWLFRSSTARTFFSFDVTHVANAGVTFGLLEDAQFPIPLIAFLATSALGLGVALWILFRTSSRDRRDRLLRIGVLIFGAGVFGNLIDRLRCGYVIDWAHVRCGALGFFFNVPAFNFADLCIAAGIAVVAACYCLRWIKRRAVSREPCKQA